MCLNITQSWVLEVLEEKIADLPLQQNALSILNQSNVKLLDALQQLNVLDSSIPRHQDMIKHLKDDWLGINFWPHTANKEEILTKGLRRAIVRANGKPISIRWVCVGRETDIDEMRFECLIDDLGPIVHVIILTPRVPYAAPPPDGVPSTTKEKIESVCDENRRDVILDDTFNSHNQSLPKAADCIDLGDNIWAVPVFTSPRP